MPLHVVEIRTSLRPQLDEIVAIWLLRKFGQNLFSGIDTAKVKFIDVADDELTSDDILDLEADGILLIGIGSGRFGKWSRNKKNSKKNDSLVMLVAKELGLEKELTLRKIFDYVSYLGSRKTSSVIDLSFLIQNLYESDHNSQKVMDWVMIALDGIYSSQVRFWQGTKRGFEQDAEIFFIAGNIAVALLVVDNLENSKFDTLVKQSNADIFVLQLSSGHIRIFTKNPRKIILQEVIKILRLKEAEINGRKIKTLDWRYLSQVGVIDEVPEWYYDSSVPVVLNGGLNLENIPPTKLSLKKIKEVLRIAFDNDYWHPKFTSSCKQGFCTATKRNTCPWYSFNLYRCRKLRENKRSFVSSFGQKS